MELRYCETFVNQILSRLTFHESWVFPGGVFSPLAVLGVEVGQLIDFIIDRGGYYVMKSIFFFGGGRAKGFESGVLWVVIISSSALASSLSTLKGLHRGRSSVVDPHRCHHHHHHHHHHHKCFQTPLIPFVSSVFCLEPGFLDILLFHFAGCGLFSQWGFAEIP